MAANKVNITGLNGSLLSNVCWLKRSTYVKFTEECDVYGEECFFVKRSFKNRQFMGLPRKTLFEKRFHG